MSKTVELNIPKTAAARDAARSFGAGAFSDEWLEQLCAHVDEGGLVGEIAAKALLSEVLRLREFR